MYARPIPISNELDVEMINEIEETGSEFVGKAEENKQLPDEMIDSFNKLTSRVRQMMKFYKYGKWHDELENMIRVEKPNFSLSIDLDCPTRWNSILLMLEKFCKHFEHMKKHRTSVELDFEFSNCDLTRCQELVNILSLVEKAIKEIGKSDANLMVADIEMSKCLNQVGESTELRRTFSSALKTRYNQRRSIISDILFDINEMETISQTSNIFYQKPTFEQVKKIFSLIEGENNVVLPANESEILKNPRKFRQDYIDTDLLNDVLLKIKPSSIDCEQAFSVCSRIKIPIRGRLSPKHFNDILFLNMNL